MPTCTMYLVTCTCSTSMVHKLSSKRREKRKLADSATLITVQQTFPPRLNHCTGPGQRGRRAGRREAEGSERRGRRGMREILIMGVVMREMKRRVWALRGRRWMSGGAAEGVMMMVIRQKRWTSRARERGRRAGMI